MAQGALGAGGVKRVWAEAGLQRTGMGHIVRLPTQLVVIMTVKVLIRVTLLQRLFQGQIYKCHVHLLSSDSIYSLHSPSDQ